MSARCRLYERHAIGLPALRTLATTSWLILWPFPAVAWAVWWHVKAEGALVFVKACEMGLEGIVSKRAGSLYRSGTSRTWLKCRNPEFQRGDEARVTIKDHPP
jgi:hypothetical protein